LERYIKKEKIKTKKQNKNSFKLKYKTLVFLLSGLLFLSCVFLMLFLKENSLLKQQSAKDEQVIAMQSEVLSKTSDLNKEKDIKIKKISTYISEMDKFATKIVSFLKIKKPTVIENNDSSNLEKKPTNRALASTVNTGEVTSRSSSITVVDPLISKSEQLVATLKQAEGVANNYEISKNGIPSIWPLYGIITSDFGIREDPITLKHTEIHEGIDITAYYGAPIRATASGIVIQSGINGTYGISCTIDHENGYQTLYGHMSRAAVSVGDRIVRGQVIGYEGNTGKVTGPHLHYEIRINGIAVDPLKYLP
jgi:murein DD-endopeptidase MepM/ murein hydrolase activator NlpD